MKAKPPIKPRKIKVYIPLGILFLLIYIVIELITLGHLFLTEHSFPIATLVLSGMSIRLYVIANLIILITIILGIIHRKSWARSLGIGWYAYNMLLASINYITFQNPTAELINMYQQLRATNYTSIPLTDISQLLLFTLVFIWTTGSLIIFYLYRSKKYFSK